VNDTRPSLPALVSTGLILALAVTVMAARVVLSADDDRPTLPSGSDPATDAATGTTPDGVSEGGFRVWALTSDGDPLRWDACRPIDLVVALEGAPTGADDDLRQAAARLSAASGLTLRIVATSEERPRAERPLVVRDGDGWRWNPVLVAWMSPAEASAAGIPLGAPDRGVALPVAVRDGPLEGYVTGQVVLNAARTDLRPGFGDRADAWGSTLLHELAHLVGLAHVDDPAELMSVDPGRGPVTLGPGDLAGLTHIGAAAGCAQVPAPTADRRTIAPVSIGP
jgi:hypothetical protein